MQIDQIKNSVLVRGSVLGALYGVSLAFSLWLAYQLRFDFVVPPDEQLAFSRICLWVLPLKLVFLLLFRQMSILPGYFSVAGMRHLFYAVSLGSIVLTAVRLAMSSTVYAPPRSVILADYVLSFLGLAMIRLALRLRREYFQSKRTQKITHSKRVGIIGAGDVGVSLARELAIKGEIGLNPVAFFDDNPKKWHSQVDNIPVIGPPEELLDHVIQRLKLEEIIIAMPSAPAKRIREVVQLLQQVHLRFETVPSLGQLATGEVKVSQLRPVEIEDLLGRDPIRLEMDNIRRVLADRRVLVTGAGGSIGSELCRQIASFHPKRLMLVERAEVQLYPIEQELIELGHEKRIIPLVADILDAPRMRHIFGRYRPDVIFHAAAHKHVPMMEHQPGEAIRNNTVGTGQLAEQALEFGVERFVMISTDKAINPTNVMGATKRLAEIYLQALHASQPDKTKFMAVRFGNVLGSSGSVIPRFKKQIAQGGPVKVTHPDMTRYFMTIPEAVGLVLQSAAQGQGGEIFVLDMGSPVKIVDLARQLIELSGLKLGEDIEIEFTGLRPGEKLFEELSYKGENYSVTQHAKIMRFTAQPYPLTLVKKRLHQLTSELPEAELNRTKWLLKRAVPEYNPYLTEPEWEFAP